MAEYTRREFSRIAAAGVLTLPVALRAQARDPWAGERIVDCHFHPRMTVEANLAHLDGAGISNAIGLTGNNTPPLLKEITSQPPGRFLGWFTRVPDIKQPDALAVMADAVKSGAIGFGEVRYPMPADSPELRRLYALAADLNVPVVIHFQDVPDSPTGQGIMTGFRDFEAVLRAHPKTRFIGHAQSFWANISAGFANDVGYPSGPVTPGGITDKLLSDYGNFFGDLSAYSGTNALTRDPEFTAGFLRRHQDKLIFGSDCSRSDGNGAGQGQALLPGKCIARETLTVLKRSASPDLFRKLVWENAHKIYALRG